MAKSRGPHFRTAGRKDIFLSVIYSRRLCSLLAATSWFRLALYGAALTVKFSELVALCLTLLPLPNVEGILQNTAC